MEQRIQMLDPIEQVPGPNDSWAYFGTDGMGHGALGRTKIPIIHTIGNMQKNRNCKNRDVKTT